jgi:prepilin-type N-terminal cleavage/methylation domain-containing protein
MKVSTNNKINKKSGFTLTELLVVIAIVGILVGIVVVSLQASKKKARFASFRSTVSSVKTAAIICAGESQLDEGSMTISADDTAICSDTSAEPSNYPVLRAGVCDGNSYDVAATDATFADDIYQLEFSCTIGGEPKTITCDEKGCR